MTPIKSPGVTIQFSAIAFFLLLQTAPLAAQDSLARKAPSVKLIPPEVTNVYRGKANTVKLDFEIESGFHINSNKPSEEYLIPTVLKLDPPTDLVVGKIVYPPGEEMSFPFAPNEQLSVYSGQFTLAVSIRPLSSVLPGKYEFRGQMRYQACDNAACYPPKQLPVQFEVKVTKAPHAAAGNPGQSPHVHN